MTAEAYDIADEPFRLPAQKLEWQRQDPLRAEQIPVVVDQPVIGEEVEIPARNPAQMGLRRVQEPVPEMLLT